VPGDYPKISQAVAASTPGDSVAVSPGAYTDDAAIGITIPLTIYSTAGAEVTILDGEEDHRLFTCSVAEIFIHGLSFVNGLGVSQMNSGGALLVYEGAVVVLEDCVFRNCAAETGGALRVGDNLQGLGTTLVSRRCVFEDNTSVVTGGAAYVVLGANGTFEGCTFRGNVTEIGAGAVHAHRAMMNFESCLFQGNRSSDIAGGLYYGTSGEGFVRNCTFVDHTSPGSIAGTIVAGSDAEITRSVFVRETNGFGVRWYTGEGAHSCNAFWENASGAMGSGSLGLGDIVVDPLFCNPVGGDFTLAADSPCLPGNHPQGVDCGLIGALDQGCGPVAVERESWGRMKGRFR
jgi:hypothetical protein